MTEDSNSPGPPVLQIHYLKTANYREVPCHGVIGGVTPQGQLWMSLYTERHPIPRTVTLPGTLVPGQPGAVRVDEKLVKPISVDTRAGIVRTIEVSTYLDLDGARRLVEWLRTRVEQMEAQKK